MKTGTKNRGKYTVSIAAVMGVASLGLSAVFVPAFAAKVSGSVANAPTAFFDQFTPAGVDSRLAKKFNTRSQAVNAGDFPFTPSGVGQGGKTLTVAARSQAPNGKNAISVRNSIAAVEAGRGNAGRLRKSEFRLTSAKGWQGFNLIPEARTAIQTKAPMITGLGKSNFRLDKGPKEKPSRFKPAIAVDKDRSVTPAARGNAAPTDYEVGVGGSFSISRKVDVTAGVRYKSENDRITPTTNDQKDSEAVFVGTKIRF